jgi:hypothetical protein
MGSLSKKSIEEIVWKTLRQGMIQLSHVKSKKISDQLMGAVIVEEGVSDSCNGELAAVDT